MRWLLFLLCLLCSCSENLGADRAAAEIYSINICQGPNIFFSGFAFYADRKGNVFVQQYFGEPAKLKERRIVLRKRPEIFQRLLKVTNLKLLLNKPPGREMGSPEELRHDFEFVLTNGVRVAIGKWDHEKSKALDPILATIEKLGATALKEPTVEIIEPADQSDLNSLHYFFEKD